MRRYKLKMSLIVIGFIGFGALISFITIGNPDLENTKTIISLICLFIISIASVINGVLIKK